MAASERRAGALKRLRDSGGVNVWLTLPVDPYGIAASGSDPVATTLAADVDLAGVNT